jgi:hypothetical protein
MKFATKAEMVKFVWDKLKEQGVEGVEYFHIVRGLRYILEKMEESFENGWMYN